MKRVNFLFLVLIFIGTIDAQTVFERGYIINNTGAKVDCLIKNIDWNDNPETFKYKVGEDSKVLRGTLKNIEEFGTNNFCFRRFNALVDTSAVSNLNNYSKKRNPEFESRTVFLKYLIKAETSLLKYSKESILCFYYLTDDVPIQLVHKKYTSEKRKILENNQFKQQLLLAFPNANHTTDELEKMKYSSKDLIKFFSKINNPEALINFKVAKKRDLFDMFIRLGSGVRSFKSNSFMASSFRNINYNTTFNLQVGLQFEFYLPFYNNSYSIIVEPRYQKFNTQGISTANSFLNGSSDVNFKSIDVALGVKYQKYLGGLPYYLRFALFSSHEFNNSIITYDFVTETIPLKPVFYSELAFGTKIKDLISVDVAYSFNNDLFEQYTLIYSQYKGFSLNIGIKLF